MPSSNNITLPHLIYMLADNIGYGNIGYIRSASAAGPTQEVQTPNIDKLAAHGVILERLYAYEFCSPSRSALLSGRLPAHVNIHNDDQTRPGAGIPADMTALPAKLKQAGYRTHHLVRRRALLEPLKRRALSEFCVAARPITAGQMACWVRDATAYPSRSWI